MAAKKKLPTKVPYKTEGEEIKERLAAVEKQLANIQAVLKRMLARVR